VPVRTVAADLGSPRAPPAGEATVIETDETGGTAVMSVRLPRNVIAQLKALAEQRKTGATVLARDLIIESLAAQPGTMSGTIPVAEVLQLVTAHGYVIGGRRAVSAAKAAKSTARKAPTRLAAKSAPVKPRRRRQEGSERQRLPATPAIDRPRNRDRATRRHIRRARRDGTALGPTLATGSSPATAMPSNRLTETYRGLCGGRSVLEVRRAGSRTVCRPVRSGLITRCRSVVSCPWCGWKEARSPIVVLKSDVPAAVFLPA
jgi:hypothetical protein